MLSDVFVGQDSAVGIATRYRLDGPVTESWRGPRFYATVQNGPSYNMGTGSFQWVKRPGRGNDHPLPSSAQFKERIELYIYSPLGLCGLF